MDFYNREILLAYKVRKDETHHYTKFRQIGKSFEEILQFFDFLKMAAVRVNELLGRSWTTHEEYLLSTA